MWDMLRPNALTQVLALSLPLILSASILMLVELLLQKKAIYSFLVKV